MQLNSEDGGNRKFIMVQIPEATDENSEAYKAGYKNICEIGKERIRRAGQKILNQDSQDKKDSQDLFNPENLANPKNPGLDIGFRVYRLDSSNMQDVYYKPQDYAQASLDLFADNVKEDRNAEDLLTQIMLDWGLPLSLKIERKTIAGKEVFAVAGDSLYACFDMGIDEAFAKAIAQEKPLRIVFRDKGFKDDTAKENVKQLLKQLSVGTEMKVI
jgi:adenine-specific DNA-methyltransferase